MVGCSLTEAFPDTAEKSGKIARKEERRRAKACPGPALTFLKDADRQAELPPPTPDKLTSESFGNGEDVIGSMVPMATTPSQIKSSKKTSFGEPVPSYFGKSIEDSFADYSKSLTDNPGYQLQGEFNSAFSAKGLEKPGGGNLLPEPSMENIWKPLAPKFSGNIPVDGHENREQHEHSFSREEKEGLLKKLDTLFARLEDLETKRNEYAHAEITLFILSGLFLIFGLESLRKI
jgi:hypothetical protein